MVGAKASYLKGSFTTLKAPSAAFTSSGSPIVIFCSVVGNGTSTTSVSFFFLQDVVKIITESVNTSKTLF